MITGSDTYKKHLFDFKLQLFNNLVANLVGVSRFETVL